MNIIGRYRNEILLYSIIVIFFLTSRLFNLSSLPIFTDEAIYLRWAQIAKDDASWRFISLTDGKQPMYIWFVMIAMRFVSDPLLAGRLVSCVAGLFSLVGLFFLGKELFSSRWAGIGASFLYAVYPFALVYDRMALYDSLVGTFAVWSSYFIVLLARTPSLSGALITAMVIGGGMLTKTNAFFNLYLLPVSLILFPFKRQKMLTQLTTWISLAFLIAILSNLYYAVLRLSPFFHIIEEKNALFVYPFSDWLLHPFSFLWGNLSGQWNWLHIYMTWPALALVLLAFLINRSFFREKIFLFLWFLFPFIALALFGRVLYPRFIFFMTLPLLLLVAFSLQNLYVFLNNKKTFALCLFLFIFPALISGSFVIFDFVHAPIPIADLGQYVNGWPSGGGVKEAVVFFKEQSKTKKIFVATQGTFGLMPAAFELYLGRDRNVTIEGFWPIGDTMPKKALEMSRIMPTYFVFYQPCDICSDIGVAPQSWPLELARQYTFSTSELRYFSIYRVKK